MADKTGIEWTDATWNPIRGCSRVSEGCRNCYAEGVAKRFSGEGQPYDGLIARTGQWNGTVRFVEHLLDWPLRKRKPMRIFVNSMSDLFHESIPDEWIDRIFAVMAISGEHTFQVLTKRPERMRDYLSVDRRAKWAMAAVRIRNFVDPDALMDSIQYEDRAAPNVWLGVSVEDQATADERIPLLLQTPTAVRWVSAEPLLGPVDLLYSAFDGAWPFKEMGQLDWVVVGGESGRNARPMHPDWARSLRDQCQTAGVPFLFKQWGEFAPNWYNDDQGNKIEGSEWIDRMGKKAAGRTLDGRLHDEYPEAQR